MRLPKELRLQVLEYSDLVDPRFGSMYHQFIAYRQGRIQIGSLHANREKHTSETLCDHCPLFLSSSLLRVSKTIYDEAFEVMLTCNLLVLESGHVQNLKFLQSLSPLLRKRIRHLDIRFDDDIDIYDDDEYGCCRFRNIPDFDLLIDYISRQLSLGQLRMSLDLFSIYWGVQSSDNFTRAQSLLALRAIKRISLPLIKLRGVQQLHVFLPLHMQYEYIMEKIAVGPDYDSLKDGKPPLADRHPDACHAIRNKKDIKDRWWYLKDVALEPDRVMHEQIEDWTASCNHPELVDGLGFVSWEPYRRLPGPGKRYLCVWYDQKACMEALKMASTGFLPGNNTLV